MARCGGGRTRRICGGGIAAVGLALAAAPAADAASVAFAPKTVSVAEGASGTTNVTVTATHSCGLLEFASTAASFVVTPGTATAGSDYVATPTPASNTFTCTAGISSGSQDVTIPVKGDTLDEADETFTVAMVVGGATVDTATVTITDDDAPPVATIAAPAAAAPEGTGTAGPGLVFPVSLSTASGRAVTLSYATADGTASAADYTGTQSGSVTIPAGQTTGTITVPVAADDLDEDDETLGVTIALPAGTPTATLDAPATRTATGTIADDDTATITLTGASVVEGAAGTTTVTNAVVNLSTPSAKAVSVLYGTLDGTATAKVDYAPAAGAVTVPAGARTALIPVTVIGDAAAEPDETFAVKIASPTNAAIASGGDLATITIRNDDAATPGGGTGGGTTTTPPGTGVQTTPGTGTGTTGVLPIPGTSGAGAKIGLGRLVYRKATASMRFDVRCPEAAGRCQGTVTVFTVPARKAKVKALRIEQQLGSARFDISAGGTKTVSLRLSKRAKGWLKAAKSVKVVAYAVSKSSKAGVSTAKVAGTLKR